MVRPSRPFRRWDNKQSSLLPLDTADWLPEGHLALFIDAVVGRLVLDAFYVPYDNDGRGCVPYDPGMMVCILLYGYAIGVTSSRKLERRTIEDIAFRYLAGGNTPDHHTISEFRRIHRAGLVDLFHQILEEARKAGMARMGRVALDGTRVKANAAMDRTWSVDKLVKERQRLLDDIKRSFDEAERIDREENVIYGDEKEFLLPKGMRTRKEILERMDEARRQIEEDRRKQLDENQLKEEEAAKERKKKEDEEARKGKKLRGRKPKELDEKQMRLKEAKRNVTDPDSRLMNTRSGYIQGYNVQLAVDMDDQMIVAVAVTQDGNDRNQLNFMLDRMEATVGLPAALAADNGYRSRPEMEAARRRTDLYIAMCDDPRDLPIGWGEGGPPLCLSAEGEMSWKMASPAGRAFYRMRSSSVEPINGQLKEQQGMRQFDLRGRPMAELEAILYAMGSNLKKMCHWPAEALEKRLGRQGKVSEGGSRGSGSCHLDRKQRPSLGISGAI
jgi:transposase